MADRLAKIFGTEEDKVNCPFYFKIGACRHGDTCTRHHNKPPLSQTMVFSHLYENPPAAVAFSDGLKVPESALVEAVNHFEDFYEEVFMELAKFGEIEEMAVADNIGDHMIGNVYTKFVTEEQAKAAMQGLNGRFYAGRTITCEYSPVSDFREAKCRQYNDGQCDRGGYCNFMHPKHVSRDLKRTLNDWMYSEFPDYREARRKRKEEGADQQFDKSETQEGSSRQQRPPSRRSKSRSPASYRHKKEHKDREGSDRRGAPPSFENKRDRYHDDKHHSRRRNSRSRSPAGGDRQHQRRKEEPDRSRENTSRQHHSRSNDYRSRDRDHHREHHPRTNAEDRVADQHYKKHRKSSSRDRDNNHGASENHGQRMARMTSEERRQMIAAWGDEPQNQQQTQSVEGQGAQNGQTTNESAQKDQVKHEEQKEGRPSGGDLSNPEYQVKQQTN